MSPRQFVLTFSCLLSSFLATTDISAQGQPKPKTRQNGGFIQQLRSLPDQALQTLEAAESGSYAPVPVHTQPFPPQPTGRSTLQRTHQSPWLERMAPQQPMSAPQRSTQQRSMQQRSTSPHPQRLRDPVAVPQNFSDYPQSTTAQQSRQGFWLSDGGAAVEGEYDSYEATLDDYPQEPAGIQDYQDEIPLTDSAPIIDSAGLNDSVASDRGVPQLYKSNARLMPETGRDDPLTASSSTVEAVASETLQQAPRVSRVPLPRTAVSSRTHANDAALAQTDELPQLADDASASAGPALESNSADIAAEDVPTRTPMRISALSTSASLSLGTSQITSAQLTSSPDEQAGDYAGESVSVPTQLPDLPLAERQLNDDLSLPPTLTFDSTGEEPANPPMPTGNLPLPDSAAGLDSSGLVGQSGSASNPLGDGHSVPLPGFQETQSNLSVSSRVTNPAAEPHASPMLGNQSPSTDWGTKSAETTTELGAVQGSQNHPSQRVKLETPHVQVTLNGPSNLPIGVPSPYEIVVHNTDQIDMQGLILRLDIPPGVKVQTLKPTHGEFEVETAADGLTMLTWGFEYLPAGQSATAPMQLVASTAKNFAVAMEWTLMPVSATSELEVRAPRLELALEGPSEVQFGQPNVYRLHIRNPGNARAAQIAVRLSAEPYGSSTTEIPAVEPGEEEVIDVELTFNEQGAIRIAADAQEQSGLASQTAISVIVRQAKISAQIAAPQMVYHGSESRLQVQLTNSGDADATDLRASFDLPEGASVVVAPEGSSTDGRRLTWLVPKLVAGSSEAFAIQLKLTGAGENQFQFACSGPGALSAEARAITQVEAITDLKLFVSDPIAPAPVGSEVVYELTLTNRGSKAATNVKVIAQFSDGIEPVRCEGQPSRVVPGQSFFEPIAKIGAGETVKLKVFAQAASAGTHRFRVEVRADETQVRLVQEESTQYLEAVGRIASPPANSLMR